MDARNGGFASITQELLGGAYSQTYKTYKITESFKWIDIDFIVKLLSTKEMTDRFSSVSKGTTNRRPVKPKEFEEMPIPYSVEQLREMNSDFLKLNNRRQKLVDEINSLEENINKIFEN